MIKKMHQYFDSYWLTQTEEGPKAMEKTKLTEDMVAVVHRFFLNKTKLLGGKSTIVLVPTEKKRTIVLVAGLYFSDAQFS